MSDEKKYTERDVVMRERAAFIAGIVWWRGSDIEDRLSRMNIEEYAKRKYASPSVTRPRVVAYGPIEWSCIDGVIGWRFVGNADWQIGCLHQVDAKLVRLLADLLANPTETVPVEDV